MGECSSDQGNANYKFFFELMHDIHDTYPIVFQGKGSHRPRAREYTEFKEKWGFIDTFYQICDSKVEKIGEVYQLYLSDFLQYLSWLIDKAEAEEAQDKFDEERRKAMKGRH